MGRQRQWDGWRTWLTGVVCVLLPCGGLQAQEAAVKPARFSPSAAILPPTVPLEEIPTAFRERVRRIIESPTLGAHGPVEVFRGRMDLYQWLLDHPDRGVSAWRRLGVKCGDITDRGNGRHGWSDGQGSDIRWDTVLRTPRIRVWLAEGSVKPGPLLPAVSVQAVAVIRCCESSDGSGRTMLFHQGDLYLYTDSKAVALAAELLGQSAQDLAGQAVGQMELFFSAIVWYLERHPERTDTLLTGVAAKNDEARPTNDEKVTKRE